MIRLAKYLKPFLPLILISIVLLFIQGMADLSLPDYIAKIVNTGIQQGGVENAIPQAMRQSEWNHLTLFLSADEQSEILADYTLVDSSSPDYSADLQKYPALANEPVYVLKSGMTQDEIDQLNPVLGKAFLATYSIQQIMDDPSKAANLPQSSGFNIASLPPGTDIFAMLQNLPALIRTPILNSMNEKFASMDSSMLVQSAAPAIKAEYAALGMDTGALQNNYILNVGVIMLGLSLISGVSTIVVGFLSARVAAGSARNLRRDLFEKVESFSSYEFDKFTVSSLITRTTNDVTQLQTLIVILIRIVFYAPILGVGGIIKATGTDSSMWWIIALGVIALIGVIATLFSMALPKFKIIQTLVDRLNLVTRENLSGLMVVRAFNTQKFEEQRFDKANLDVTNTNLSVTRIMAAMLPSMMLIMNGMTLLIIWVGAHQVADAQMQVGDMIAFMQYGLQVVFAFLMLSFIFILVPRAAVSADRIADVLETELLIHDPKDPKHFRKPFDSTLEFRHVSFRYPGAEADVLHDLNFTAQPGQTTAFIGSTGSGKSTLVNLIPRFYDVTEGQILIDGTDIRDVPQQELREQLGYIPQKANLFSGTIESNLRYADADAPLELLQEATEIAQASNFIAEKPEGLATEIAQGGGNVSGGQRQRLSIARALVKQAPIYIFDDSFSALDFKTDAALRRALREKTSDSTLLIVTQRVSTVKNAEQIIVLDEGKIVGKGTHNELMETCEVYREIALSQLGIEELAS
ncbi:MAG: ATP-binding cassette domain-containing protein [Chloroflexi bacterium]|nr:ATP-binding cassette domain-containing protein [Chloroflexota bacterium]